MTNLKRAGGWMKIKKKKGFTIIESLIYIFMTTLILNEGLFLIVLMYRSYLYNAEITKEYNDIQNFYIELQGIISEPNVGEIKCSDNKLIFSKYDDKTGEEKKSIQYEPEGKSVVVKYSSKPENKMIGNISDIHFIKKNKLIYIVIYDEDGREFISCV